MLSDINKAESDYQHHIHASEWYLHLSVIERDSGDREGLRRKYLIQAAFHKGEAKWIENRHGLHVKNDLSAVDIKTGIYRG